MNSIHHFHPGPDHQVLKDDNRRIEMIKIMIQTLDDLGFKDSAKKLIEESQIRVETDELLQFRQNILNGNWDKAKEYLNSLGLKEENF